MHPVLSLLLAATFAAALCGPVQGQPTTVLDTTAYWHYYLHGGPVKIHADTLKNDGEKLLGPAYKEVERNTRAALKQKGRNPDDWHTEVHYPIGYLNLERLQEATTSAPPANWAAPEFDDSDWACYRKPYKMGKDFAWDGCINPTFQIKTSYFRSSFDVPDPAKAGTMTLRLLYRGGMRALVNGQELARGHLPPGELTAETMADLYPKEAYRLLESECPKDPKHMSRAGPFVPDLTMFIGRPDRFDLLDKTYEENGKSYSFAGAGGFGGKTWLTREGWERIPKIRNRVLEAKVPQKLLRKGTNVLAIEVHTSELNPLALIWSVAWEGAYTWEHGWLMDVALTTTAQDLPSVFRRPPGVQVWPVDVHHRLYSPEFQPPGNLPKRLWVVAAKSGTFGAELAVGTDRELTGLKATVSDFQPVRRADGQSTPQAAKLPASIARVLYGVSRPERDLRTAGWGKGEGGEGPTPGLTRVNSEVILDRFSKYPDIVAPKKRGSQESDDQRKHQEEEIARIQFFDQLSPKTPKAVPADTCQPAWFSVNIPREATAGMYRATVRVEAEGMQPVEMPFDLEVADWCLPDPRDFQAIVAFEQSPYGVARHYNVEPWTEEHFKLLEKSVQLLGRLGNDFLGIPVVCKTELGNHHDSPLRITRKQDGSFSFDFTRVDRYLDMALKHWGAPPWCICFVVDHPQEVKDQNLLPVIDEASGEVQYVQIGAKAPADVRRNTWRAVTRAIAEHMRSRGLLRHTYWGLHGDGTGDPGLLPLLKEFVPEVKWACYSHQRTCDDYYTFCANVRMAYLYPITSLKGWKALTGPINCWLPRHWNSIAVTEGVSAPPSFRIGIERALASGCPGMARAGADYWEQTWVSGTDLHPYAGNPITAVFWPGEDGAETSARFEMLCEGVQETEARIFLEQAMEKLDDAELTRQLTAMLDRRLRDTTFALTTAPHLKIEEYISGWQKRSQELYQACGLVGRRLGVDLNRTQVVAKIPVRGKGRLDLVVRNWTSQERTYRLSSEQDWLKPPAAEAKAKLGFQALPVVLDGTKLEPGKPVKGTLTLTDVATGRSERVEIDAQASELLQLTSQSMSANVPPDVASRHALTLLNSSGADLDYSIATSVPWVQAEPAKGKLSAGTSCPISVVITPAGKAGGRYDVALEIAESGGEKVKSNLAVHVVPEYKAPAGLPAGQAVPLESLVKEKGFVTRWRQAGEDRTKQGPPSFFKPDRDNRALPVGRTKNAKRQEVPVKELPQGLQLAVTGELVLNIEGKGFSAFSAEVGPHFNCRFGQGVPWGPKLHFEVYVDGQFAGHSGLMELSEGPRLIVVSELTSAKELRLVTRVDFDRDSKWGESFSITGVWGNTVLYK